MQGLCRVYAGFMGTYMRDVFILYEGPNIHCLYSTICEKQQNRSNDFWGNDIAYFISKYYI